MTNEEGKQRRKEKKKREEKMELVKVRERKLKVTPNNHLESEFR